MESARVYHKAFKKDYFGPKKINSYRKASVSPSRLENHHFQVKNVSKVNEKLKEIRYKLVKKRALNPLNISELKCRKQKPKKLSLNTTRRTNKSLSQDSSPKRCEKDHSPSECSEASRTPEIDKIISGCSSISASNKEAYGELPVIFQAKVDYLAKLSSALKDLEEQETGTSLEKHLKNVKVSSKMYSHNISNENSISKLKSDLSEIKNYIEKRLGKRKIWKQRSSSKRAEFLISKLL